MTHEYNPPTIRENTWYPGAGQKLTGRLVSVRGVAYEFAPTRALPVLNLAVPATTDGFLATTDGNGTVEMIEATMFVEVHCFPVRLLDEVETVRPRLGELVEITTDFQLVGGFLVYAVTAGGRWSATEHWGPDEIEAYCPFGAQPIESDAHTPGERTAVFHPVTVPDVAAEEALAGFAAANPLFVPSPTKRVAGE